MRIGLCIPVVALALFAAPDLATAQPASDPRVADLVRAGEIRIGTFPPQYSKDPATGELRGVFVEFWRMFAARIGVKPVLVEFPTPPRMVECLKSGACDVSSLGFDPTRVGDVEGFSPAFIEFDYTYLLPAGSSIRGGADADQPSVRIAVVNAHASTLTLARIRKQAELVTVDTPDAAFDLLRAGRVDAWASIRPTLLDYSERLPGSRVLEDRFGANKPTVVVAKGHAARLAYFSELVEEMKASGAVQEAIARSGWRGVRVAPAASPRAQK
jgi:polar amino acid transport system substrate-binding protein